MKPRFGFRIQTFCTLFAVFSQSAYAGTVIFNTVCLDPKNPKTCVTTIVPNSLDGCVMKGELAECPIQLPASSGPLVLTKGQLEALRRAPIPTDAQIKAHPLN
jgi:hypothetical protein